MPFSRWLRMTNVGLAAFLLAGCLPVVGKRPPRPAGPPAPRPERAETAKRPAQALTDYLTTAEAAPEPEVKPASMPPEPTELRLRRDEAPPPVPPADPPEPKVEVRPAPPARPEAAPVAALRGLLDAQSEPEIREQLGSYDADTREALLLLLASAAQLDRSGGLSQLSPRDLAAWADRLNALTASLRPRAQLVLEQMCFCSHIKSFGQYRPLPAEHSSFQPGEDVHVYVQVRNFASRRVQDQFQTVLKARAEIYEENNRSAPVITSSSEPRADASASPRQDYFINFHFRVPHSFPAGLYTLRITVEDWTEAAAGADRVPKARAARSSLDFRVGGPVTRPAEGDAAR